MVPLVAGSATALVERYDAGLLDLDGVVYIGPEPVPHASESLAQARARGMRLAFVTNNASRTPQEVAAHLTELGVAADPAEVATSAQAAARLVAGLVAPGSAVLVVGGPALEEALIERGLRPVRSADDKPSAVVQGYHPSVGWMQLAEGTFAVRAGLPWVASNTDLTIPTPRGIGPGNGTLVNVIRQASGVEPLVAGKPELALHRESIDRVAAQRPLIIGDRLDTDVEGAVRAGTDSLLVLTGVTGPVELLAAPPSRRPTYVSADLRGLLVPHDDVELGGGEAALGGWTARVQAGRLRLTGAGNAVDALRAACVATWVYPGAVDTGDVVVRLAAGIA
ncbi:MAG TPA: HAD-IIA family hydrolase [Sporichthya sp.]|nr:HAD-IIA family hydrolase [Sporichthya sp.]